MMSHRILRFGAVLGVVTALLAADGASTEAEASTRSAHNECVRGLVHAAATANAVVPPALALAVAHVESGFRPDALSNAGARGVMQIMPATAWSEFSLPRERLWDPKSNAEIGVEYLARLYDRYDGDWRLALSHYNGGSLSRIGGIWRSHRYTLAYVDRVHHYWRRYTQELRRSVPSSVPSGEACATETTTPSLATATPGAEASKRSGPARFRLDPIRAGDRLRGRSSGMGRESGDYVPLTGSRRFR